MEPNDCKKHHVAQLEFQQLFLATSVEPFKCFKKPSAERVSSIIIQKNKKGQLKTF